MADDADWAADMAEREREALIARHRARAQAVPAVPRRIAPPPSRGPAHLGLVMDDPREAR